MNSTQSVACQLRTFVRENYLFGGNVLLGDEDSFLERGIIDSTGVLELVSFVEREFGIAVSDDELVPENLDSIRNATNFVEKKLGLASV